MTNPISCTNINRLSKNDEFIRAAKYVTSSKGSRIWQDFKATVGLSSGKAFKSKAEAEKIFKSAINDLDKVNAQFNSGKTSDTENYHMHSNIYKLSEEINFLMGKGNSSNTKQNYKTALLISQALTKVLHNNTWIQMQFEADTEKTKLIKSAEEFISKHNGKSSQINPPTPPSKKSIN